MMSEASSSSAPPTIAPTRDMPSAIACKRPIRSPPPAGSLQPPPAAREPGHRLRRRRLQPEHLTHRIVPLLGAFGAAALGPAGQDAALDELLVRLGLFRLHRHDDGLGELAHAAGL